MKTALTQLLEKKEKALATLNGVTFKSPKVRAQISNINYDIKAIKELLPIERELIENAYLHGYNNGNVDSGLGNKDYFNKTFK